MRYYLIQGEKQFNRIPTWVMLEHGGLHYNCGIFHTLAKATRAKQELEKPQVERLKLSVRPCACGCGWSWQVATLAGVMIACGECREMTEASKIGWLAWDMFRDLETDNNVKEMLEYGKIVVWEENKEQSK